MQLIRLLDEIKFIDGIGIPLITPLWNDFIAKIQFLYLKRIRVPEKRKVNKSIVVSMTTFPVRNRAACYAIKSILLQSMQPGKIVVYLSQEQYQCLPIEFNVLHEKFGINFCFVEGDLKSHKKYLYAFRDYPNKLIITVDDDLIYPENLIETLYAKYKENPNTIICFRGRKMAKDKQGNMLPYSKWNINEREGVEYPSYDIMPSTGAGTLYFPGSVDDMIYNTELIKENALTADDIWVKTMSLKRKTKVIKSHNRCRYLSAIKTKGDKKLYDMNRQCGNDRVVERLVKIFPEAFELIGCDYED